MWAWLRWFVTISNRDTFSRGQLLALLDTVASNPELVDPLEFAAIADQWEASLK